MSHASLILSPNETNDTATSFAAISCIENFIFFRDPSKDVVDDRRRIVGNEKSLSSSLS